jgi:ABC-2 type transport system permease protein
MMQLLRFELLLLLRNRLCAFALACVLTCSALALHQGDQVIRHQIGERQRVSGLLDAQNSARALAIPGAGADAGDLAYYSFHPAADTHNEWSLAALGNRRFEPSVQRIRMLGLQAQLYDGQAQNPEISIAGSFDFSFVAVFLLPLLCIVLCHNVYSSECETGRMALLQTCGARVQKLFQMRLFVRAGCAWIAVFLPLLLFALYQRLSITPLVLIAFGLLMYVAFWTLAVAGLAPARHSSAMNAVSGLTFWVALVLLVPQLGQMLINQAIATPQGKQIALAHRKSVASAWDIPKQESFNVFFRAHPEWQDTAPVLGRFHWKWYYAFHHAADMQLADTVQAYEAQIRARQRAADYLAFVSPAIALQSLLERIADSRIERVLAKRTAITEFHTELRRYFYPFVFDERLMTRAEFLAAPRLQNKKTLAINAVMQGLAALVWLCVFWCLGLILLLRRASIALDRNDGCSF